jgi:hypothetical protein
MMSAAPLQPRDGQHAVAGRQPELLANRSFELSPVREKLSGVVPEALPMVVLVVRHPECELTRFPDYPVTRIVPVIVGWMAQK